MSMMDEIEKLMGDVGTSANFRIINLGGNSLYVEGIKSVVSFGETEMRFQLKKCLLIVAGENLKVKYLDKTTCVLSGIIRVVETL
ncbi:MAG: YabP/YqfC family sporulation protein [Clostridia bacterium]|nr:YabP/YqfC family sporulation protein [Clostridia bacterium]